MSALAVASVVVRFSAIAASHASRSVAPLYLKWVVNGDMKPNLYMQLGALMLDLIIASQLSNKGDLLARGIYLLNPLTIISWSWTSMILRVRFLLVLIALKVARSSQKMSKAVSICGCLLGLSIDPNERIQSYAIVAPVGAYIARKGEKMPTRKALIKQALITACMFVVAITVDTLTHRSSPKQVTPVRYPSSGFSWLLESALFHNAHGIFHLLFATHVTIHSLPNSFSRVDLASPSLALLTFVLSIIFAFRPPAITWAIALSVICLFPDLLQQSKLSLVLITVSSVAAALQTGVFELWVNQDVANATVCMNTTVVPATIFVYLIISQLKSSQNSAMVVESQQ